MDKDVALEAEESTAFQAHTYFFQLLGLLLDHLFRVGQLLAWLLKHLRLTKVELNHGAEILLFLEA